MAQTNDQDQTGENLINDLDKLQKNGRNGTCTITVINGIPAEYQTVFIAGGCVFNYHDGKSYQDGPRPLNVGSGGSVTFHSNDPGGCVQLVLAAITISTDGDTQTVTAQDQVAKPDECMTSDQFTVSPKGRIKQSELGKLKAAELYELRRTV